MSDKDITELLILHDIDPKSNALDRVFPLIYDEVKRLAFSHRSKEYDEITIQPTELVHELYMKLVNQGKVNANSRKHFFGIVSNCLRQILVDHARKKKALKRGGGENDLTLQPDMLPAEERESNLIAIDELINELYTIDERAAQTVEMKFFGGMSVPQIAEVLQVSEKTVKRDWKKAKVWIYSSVKRRSEL